MSDLHIKPVDGRKLPLMSDPRRHVDRPMTVRSHAYYRRALMRGDIALVQSTKPKRKTRKTDTETDK